MNTNEAAGVSGCEYCGGSGNAGRRACPVCAGTKFLQSIIDEEKSALNTKPAPVRLIADLNLPIENPFSCWTCGGTDQVDGEYCPDCIIRDPESERLYQEHLKKCAQRDARLFLSITGGNNENDKH